METKTKTKLLGPISEKKKEGKNQTLWQSIFPVWWGQGKGILKTWLEKFNHLPENPDFLGSWVRRLLKMWEKEKTLVASIFFFSRNVFYPSLNKFQFIFSSANDFNLEQVLNFVFGIKS